MFYTTVLAFCSVVAAFQRSDTRFNLIIKLGATAVAAWAAMYAAVYWGVAP